MRRLLYLLPLIIALFPIFGDAAQLDAGRFDWSAGQPTITGDNTSICNNASKIRFDWTRGQPTIVYDVTTTCNITVPVSDDPIWLITGGQVILRGQTAVQ